jgi:chemotaxis signal transduction protein
MSGTPGGGLLTADELRRAFDAAFAARPAERDEEIERFVALKIRRHAYAVPVHDMTGFAAARKVVPLPSPIPEMLGLAGLRGALVPVYSLAALLGYPLDEAPLRWFILCGGADKVALGFVDLDGYLELPRSQIRIVDVPDVEQARAGEVLRAGDEVRAIIGISTVLEGIEKKVALAAGIESGRPASPRREPS